MATFVANVNLSNNQLLNARLQNLASDPSFAAGESGRVWLNAGLKLNNGTSIVTVRDTGTLIQNGDIATGIDIGKLTVDPRNRANHTGTQTSSTISDFSTAVTSAMSSALSSNAAADRNRANHTGTQTASTISDFSSVVANRPISSFAAATGPIFMGNFKVQGVADPTTDSDAANKRYVDSVVQGLDAKASVRVLATSLPAYTASGGVLTASANGAFPAIDGVTLNQGDRILFGGTSAITGIYTLFNAGSTGAKWSLVRTSDANTWEKLVAAFVFVESGTTYGDTGWVFTADPGGVLESSTISITQFSSAGQTLAGFGLRKTGNTLDVALDDLGGGFAVHDAATGTNEGPLFDTVTDPGPSYHLRLKEGVIQRRHIAVGAVGINQLGDIIGPGLTYLDTTGGSNPNKIGFRGEDATFGDDGFGRVTIKTGAITSTKLAPGAVSLNGNVVTDYLPINRGGTNATTAAGARANLGAVGKYSSPTHAAAASWTITAATHGLGVGRDKTVSTLIEATGEVVLGEVSIAANGDVTVGFGQTQAANTIRVTIIG